MSARSAAAPQGDGPDLPVRAAADVHLAAAFRQPGCPLCRHRRRSEAALLEMILADGVNDVPFRAELDEARGLCATHVRRLLASDRDRGGGQLSTAIVYRAILRGRLRELERARGGRSWSRRRRLGDAATPPACPICTRVAGTDASTVTGVVRLASDPVWAEAAATAPFCLAHVVALMAAPDPPPTWPDVEGRQLARLRALDEDLDALVHRSAEDRRATLEPHHVASVGLAADVLAGED